MAFQVSSLITLLFTLRSMPQSSDGCSYITTGQAQVQLHYLLFTGQTSHIYYHHDSTYQRRYRRCSSMSGSHPTECGKEEEQESQAESKQESCEPTDCVVRSFLFILTLTAVSLQRPATLLTLPARLLKNIAHLVRQHSLGSLANFNVCSKTLYAISLPILWKEVVWKINMWKYVQSCGEGHPAGWQFVE